MNQYWNRIRWCFPVLNCQQSDQNIIIKNKKEEEEERMDAPLVLPSSLQCRLFQASLQCKRWETLTKSQILSVFFFFFGSSYQVLSVHFERDGGDTMDQIPKGGMTPQGCHHQGIEARCQCTKWIYEFTLEKQLPSIQNQDFLKR